MSYCPNCGHEVEGEPRFCADCGTPLIAGEDVLSTGASGRTQSADADAPPSRVVEGKRTIPRWVVVAAVAAIGAVALWLLYTATATHAVIIGVRDTSTLVAIGVDTTFYDIRDTRTGDVFPAVANEGLTLNVDDEITYTDDLAGLDVLDKVSAEVMEDTDGVDVKAITGILNTAETR